METHEDGELPETPWTFFMNLFNYINKIFELHYYIARALVTFYEEYTIYLFYVGYMCFILKVLKLTNCSLEEFSKILSFLTKVYIKIKPYLIYLKIIPTIFEPVYKSTFTCFLFFYNFLIFLLRGNERESISVPETSEKILSIEKELRNLSLFLEYDCDIIIFPNFFYFKKKKHFPKVTSIIFLI